MGFTFTIQCGMQGEKKSTEKSVTAAGRSGREETVIKLSLCGAAMLTGMTSTTSDLHNALHTRRKRAPSQPFGCLGFSGWTGASAKWPNGKLCAEYSRQINELCLIYISAGCSDCQQVLIVCRPNGGWLRVAREEDVRFSTRLSRFLSNHNSYSLLEVCDDVFKIALTVALGWVPLS